MTGLDVGLDLDLERARAVAIEAAEIAVEVLRSTPLGHVRRKAHAADVVTDVDTATERAVRDHLALAFPEHQVVGEEYGGRADGGPTWYCDPVDGTTNLASRLPWTSFSLSLAVGHEPLVGVVADPWRGEILHAVRGGGAWRRAAGGEADEAVHAAATDRLEGAVVMSEWAAHVPFPGQITLLAALGERHCTMRVMGSGTLSVASVAAGRAAGAVIGDFHAEDHLAAVLIGHESGAVLRGFGRGQEEDGLWPEPGPFVLAASGVAEVLTGLVREACAVR
ncbi:MAG: inositol monophosphatase family protein [Lapillicoccus sp.]